MSLLELARGMMPQRGPKCGVYLLRQEHPERGADIDELVDGCRSGVVTYTAAGQAIAKAFALDRFDYQVISRHVRGLCACPRS